jgi:CHAT domain-containing protein
MINIFSWITIILPTIIIPVIPGIIEAQTTLPSMEANRMKHCLKQDEVLLEFAVTDSTAIVCATAGDSTLLASQSLNPMFWMAHQSFRKKIKSADKRGFDIAGQILYLFLIRPIQDFITGKRRLIIKTDERLSELPFEALIRPDGRSFHLGTAPNYLIRDYEIIYHSRQDFGQDALLKTADEITMTPVTDQFSFMGFSPVFYNHTGLSELPDSRKEIAEIGSLFRQQGLTSWLVYEDYSEKEYFKTVACMGKIVHLSTHYLTEAPNKGYGGFLFSGYDPSVTVDGKNEGILTIEEIKGLQLQADLIVLNACASGIVKHNSGVRDYTLPEVFIKAGARNILSTLWNVTDHLAGDFMINFYRLCLSGKTYSQALREVKLQMISCPETALPTIWAPYILTAR